MKTTPLWIASVATVAICALALGPAATADHLPANTAIGHNALVEAKRANGFNPKVNVVSGESVTIKNLDANIPHFPIDSLGAELGAPCFSGLLPGGATVTFSLADCGPLIAYHCDFHPDMKGVLIQS